MDSLLLGFTDWILCLFDIIPQAIYFLFTTLTSGIDVLQCLIRKLAGLDVYYAGGQKIVKQDPLTEFIYGILGIGNSAPAYKALNTVFWSLAIFAVILLALTTIIAIIKSHYNEDSAGTSPWKFIYTAIKSVLTFAVIPFLMVFGLKLSTFALQTLDNITAGSASEGAIIEMYGSEATTIFVGVDMDSAGKNEEDAETSGGKTYIYYDFFGAGSATTSTPLGSALFKAAAYNCNRARSGNVSFDKYLNIKSDGKQIFGNLPGFDSIATDDEKRELIAEQIDYAFCNNLHLSTSISWPHMDKAMGGQVVNLFRFFPMWGEIGSFSKFNINALWYFYYLWTFNFIVAFAGGITILGILLSVIVGLMTRLIKGAALFLIYPPLLGIAPLDNFKAFKSWSQMVIQQVLMAFGAIIGMNLVMLLLPYIDSIKFFGMAIVDCLVSLIVVIVALLMAKDFISIVSGFVGGADANTSGEGIKGQIGGALKKAMTTTGKAAGGIIKTGSAAILKAGKNAKDRKDHNRKVKLLNKKNAGALNTADANKLKQVEENGVLNQAIKDHHNSSGLLDAKDIKKIDKAVAKAQEDGVDDPDELEEIRKNATIEALKSKKIRGADGKMTTAYEQLQSEQEAAIKQAAGVDNNGKLTKEGKKAMKEYQDLKDAEALNEEDFDKETKGKNKGKFKNRTAAGDLGESIKKGFEDAGATFKALGKKMGEAIDGISIGKTIANSFAKSVGSIGEATGLDKVVGGLKDIFKGSFTMAGGPFEDKKPEGDKLQSKIAEGQVKETQQQTAILKGELEKLTRIMANTTKLQGQTLTAMNKTNTILTNNGKNQNTQQNTK